MIDILKEYLEYLEFQKRYSLNTIDSYKRDIEKFLVFMNGEGYTYKNVDEILIRNFLMKERRNNISARSNQTRRLWQTRSLGKQFRHDTSFT